MIWIVLLLVPLMMHAQPQTGDGVWLRNAYWGEAQTFDACAGHQPGSGQYHHHASPTCLRAQLGDNIELVRTARTGPVYREKMTKHSPILGWAFDGYPIYGPYGTGPNGVQRMRSGYRKRQITERTSLPQWALPLHSGLTAQLSADKYGPAVSSTFPIGRYLEDFEYVEGLGDLDIYNGRTAVTPEYPQGTYAYYVTIEEDGTPAFPYILAAQFYGTVTGGTQRTVPAEAVDDATTNWQTANGAQAALMVRGTNPAADPQTVGGNADVQRVRTTADMTYVAATGLASYVMGPWFDALQPGGVFGGLPSNQNLSVQVPRKPAAATTRRNTSGGAQGLWVNGVAVFNGIDGASYSQARAADVGGGLVSPTAIHVSAASFERGPLAAGSYATAFPLFGGTVNGVVTIRDSKGVSFTAETSYVSAEQTNYRIPETAAVGNATVTINGAASNITITDSYPNLFVGVAAGNGIVTLYGTGMGTATTATATANGQTATVLFAGPQGEFKGLDQYNVQAAPGTVEFVVTVAGRRSNAVAVVVR